MNLRGRAGKLALGALVALFALPSVASAATIQVNTTADHALNACQQPPAGDCTIRDAIGNGVAATDVINVPAGTYQLTQGELVLPTGILQGAGARSTVIRAAPNSRVIRVPTEARAVISRLTVTGGAPTAAASAPAGGGILAEGPTTNLVIADAAIVGNRAPIGGGISAPIASLRIERSTIAGNTATGGQAGGVNVPARLTAVIINSTISGNQAAGGRANDGGGIYSAGNLQLDHTTIASNVVTPGSGGTVGAGGVHQGLIGGETASAAIRDSIIAGNTGGACDGDAGVIAAWTGDHNLDDDGSCGFTAAGDKPGVNAQLVPLGNRGGATDTHSLGATSPALNAADAVRCPIQDQRGITRPQLGGCDMGATEYVVPKLVVSTSVVNDNGGTATPAAFSVHVVRSGAGDVAGSPKVGTSAGSLYTLVPGGYVVSSALAGYTVTTGGACSPAGAVALAENQAKTCTVVANDNSASASQLPPPKLHRTANLLRARGTVKIKKPKAKRYKVLVAGEQVPLGTIVDTRNGRVTLIAASDGKGHTAKAVFYGGIFKFTQTKGKKPVTVLSLVEKLTSCKASGKASVAAKKKKVKKRRLWGDGKGKFRTKGKHSAATVVGTKWLVEDRCTSTLTKVARGRVEVRDFVKKKTVLVKKGKRYLARARTR